MKASGAIKRIFTPILFVLICALFLLLSAPALAGYLGFDKQPDPDIVICLFPVNFAGGQTVSLTLVFNGPFYIVSDSNLLTGRRNGYTISSPSGRVSDVRQFEINLHFTQEPIPLCVALAALNNSREQSADADHLALVESASRLIDGQSRMSLASQAIDRRSLTAQSRRFNILSHTYSQSTLYRFAQAASRLRQYSSTRLQHTESLYRDNSPFIQLPDIRSPLYLDLANRVSDLPYPGISSHLFRYLWFHSGLLQRDLELLAHMINRFSQRALTIAHSDSPLERLRSIQAAPDSEIFRRINLKDLEEIARLFPHNGHLSQNQANLALKEYSGTATVAERTTLNQLISKGEHLMAPVQCSDDDLVTDLERCHIPVFDFASPVSNRRFRIIRLLGRGGEGSVWEVSDGQESFALKEIEYNDFVRQSTARLMSIIQQNKLRSERVMPLLEQWSDQHKLYQLMPVMRDGDLHDFIANHPEIVNQHLAELAFQIIDAAAYLHLNQVVHRDIKPLNFLVQRRNDDIRLFLSDLGLVREIDTPDAMTMSFVGTIAYMGAHTAMARAEGLPYQALKMEYETIAITLVHLATNVLLFEKFTSRATNYDEQARWQGTFFKNLATGEEDTFENIRSQLPFWLKENKDKLPAPLLEIVSMLLELPTDKSHFGYLTEILDQHQYFARYKHISEAIKLRNQQMAAEAIARQLLQMAQLQALLPQGWTIQYVNGDGDCLPTALAQSMNANGFAQELNQQLVRQQLAKLLRTILGFIENLASHIDPEGTSPELVTLQQDLLSNQLFTLTGLTIDQIEDMLQNGSIENSAAVTGPVLGEMNSWLDPGFIPILQQMLNVQINLNSPNHNQDTMLNEPFNNQFWHHNAPTLAFYLQSAGIIALSENLPEITLVFNGQTGRRGHYFFALPPGIDPPQLQAQPLSNHSSEVVPDLWNRGEVRYQFQMSRPF
ncbi:protein kinase domain-containing protein [Endozoicomonas arenosclerae]|uniref:protein kinase domain-containing protein n=1 Tax=Endozoicomonas arenosclerae TaxID=1633495 RepID=UPI0007864CCA|nr:protein kinase [Endozoicomonas arenosclerae]